MPKQHNSKKMKKLFKELRKRGFEISDRSKSGGFKIYPPDSVAGPIYFTHGTESSYHQIVRDFRKHYDVELEDSEQRGDKSLQKS